MAALLLGILLVGSSVAVSVAGLFLVRRFTTVARLREHQEVAGFIIAVLAVIYAVLLALVVVAVWEQFDAAKQTTAQEANDLADLFRMAHGLPDPLRSQIRRQTRVYVQAVVIDEWPSLARGQASPHAQDAMDELWESFEEWEPHSSRQSALYAESLTALREMSNNRRMRLLESREGIPGMMWVVLGFGACGTVAFTYFFAVENLRAQALMTALLAAEIALVMFLISALDYPFTGDLRVQPEAFIRVQDRFDSIEKHEQALDKARARPG